MYCHNDKTCKTEQYKVCNVLNILHTDILRLYDCSVQLLISLTKIKYCKILIIRVT